VWAPWWVSGLASSSTDTDLPSDTWFFIPHPKPSHIQQYSCTSLNPRYPQALTRKTTICICTRTATMTKESLDSDRVNYMIWRYVILPVIRLLGIQVQDERGGMRCFSLTTIVTSQIPHRFRCVFNTSHLDRRCCPSLPLFYP
jgi:hypothetical protein